LTKIDKKNIFSKTKCLEKILYKEYTTKYFIEKHEKRSNRKKNPDNSEIYTEKHQKIYDTPI